MRYPPLKTEEMSPRQREVADAAAHSRMGPVAGPYAPLLYAPEIASRVQVLGEHLRFDLRVPERLRVLAVLVAGSRYGRADLTSYLGLDAVRQSGLAETTLADLAEGRRPGQMKDDEVLVYDFCSELMATGHVRSATFDALCQRLGREICLELVEVCGYTAFMTMVANVTQSPFPKGAANQ